MGDMFTYQFLPLTTNDFQLTTLYLYISPWLIDKALQNISSQFPKAEYVSYFYPIEKRTEKKRTKGIHTIYCY